MDSLGFNVILIGFIVIFIDSLWYCTFVYIIRGALYNKGGSYNKWRACLQNVSFTTFVDNLRFRIVDADRTDSSATF